MLRVDSDAAKAALVQEAQLSVLCVHENINRVMAVCDDLSVISELAVNGDVRSYLNARRQEGRVEYGTLLRWCAEVAAALLEMERLGGVVHGHLSPQCCLLDAHLTIKVSGARIGPSTRMRSTHAQIRYSDPYAIVHVSLSSVELCLGLSLAELVVVKVGRLLVWRHRVVASSTL